MEKIKLYNDRVVEVGDEVRIRRDTTSIGGSLGYQSLCDWIGNKPLKIHGIEQDINGPVLCVLGTNGLMQRVRYSNFV